MKTGRYLLLRLFTAFPDGLPGVGLLLLRLAIGSATVIQGVRYFESSGPVTLTMMLSGAVALVSGSMLILGFLTPAAGTLIALGISGSALSWLPFSPRHLTDGTLEALFSGTVSAAIVLLGPGALSVDARIFGRREIMIPKMPHSPDRGK